VRNTIIPITLLLVTAACPLCAEEKPKEQQTAKAERPAVAAKITDGKRTKFGFISHTIECPTYFARYRPKTETIEVLTPDKMESGKRYPVIYALAPLTSHSVIPRKLGERYHLGPLMDIREQDLHNKHQVICIKVMAIDRHMNWNYLQDVVVPYVDRTYPTIAEPRGRLLLGFSKTGDDVWKLLLANPDIFGKACAWDSLPKWDWVEPHAELLRGKPPRLILTGATKGAMEPVAALHDKLTEEKIPHLYHLKLRDEHNWSSGWIADAMRLLFKDFKGGNASVSSLSAAETQKKSSEASAEKKYLPKVFIIGDSISQNYMHALRRELAGKAEVHRPNANCGSTWRTIERSDNLNKWLGESRWDLIHFNWGLHDQSWLPKEPGSEERRYAVALEEYEKNLRTLVKRLKETDAILIWCATTPMPEDNRGASRPHGPVQFNAVAKKVMDENGILINDLYSFALPQLDKIQKPRDVHFHGKGSAVLAKEVARQIMEALNRPAAKADDPLNLFILSGQSNMAGLSPEVSFTPAVEKAFGKDKVIVVKDAHGGQPIQRWYKEWKPAGASKAQGGNGDLYDRLMKKVDAAIGDRKVDTVTFVWMQGERDARERHGGVYGESFKGLVGQIKKHFGREDIRFVIGRLSDFDNENKRYGHWTKVREAQVKVAEADKLGAWVDTDDLNGDKNDLHYTKEGYKVLGERFAKEAIALLAKRPK